MFYIFALAISIKKMKKKSMKSRNEFENPIANEVEIQMSTNSYKIASEVPEEGYVVLNGIKRRITDCKNL